tara:strand:- start:424 stop:981 length:558 start_codon:yes stop_codon:yes gene_type:complete
MHKFNYKKYYFISEYDTNLITNQVKNINIIFRNYHDDLDINKILILRDLCRKKKIKFFLSNNIKLAINLNLDGAYIPAFNKDYKHLSYSINKKFQLIGSAHNINEINTKVKQNVKILFLSSLFKMNKNFLGLNKFRKITNLTKLNVVALGGVSIKNIAKLNLTNSIGFAGISFFEKKRPLNKGPF